MIHDWRGSVWGEKEDPRLAPHPHSFHPALAVCWSRVSWSYIRRKVTASMTSFSYLSSEAINKVSNFQLFYLFLLYTKQLKCEWSGSPQQGTQNGHKRNGKHNVSIKEIIASAFVHIQVLLQSGPSEIGPEFLFLRRNQSGPSLPPPNSPFPISAPHWAKISANTLSS